MIVNQVDETIRGEAGVQPQILVMEDESSVAQGLEMILREQGYGVDLTMTGQGALDTLRHKDFDLLVADLRLPDMDGMDVIKRVKEKRPETEIVVITGYASPPSAIEAMKHGAADYLSKPFTEEQFISAVEEAISKGLLQPVELAPAEVMVNQVDETIRGEAGVQPQILVMEDESSVAQGLEMILREHGYGVDLAMTGQGALDTLSGKGFDLLVADLRLPDMDGMDVIKRVKRESPETEIVVITGYADVSSAVEAMRRGVVDYLPKPFTEEEFMGTVDGLLRKRQEGLSAKTSEIAEIGIEKPVNTGVYLCHCGGDIAEKLSVSEVLKFAQKQPNVVIARDYNFMCQDHGLEMIERDIREMGLDRVVVAGCSSGVHEKRFQGVCQDAGLKTHQFQMVSVREQVSWVTEDPEVATGRARTLVAAALHRVRYQRTLTAGEASVHPDILVVGGGIAGMQAALDIAHAGHRAYLVERQPTIGGHMLQFDKTFPTLDCAACIGTPKMVSVGQDPNIEVLTYSEVKEISGSVGNFRVKIHRNPRYVKEDLCTGCGECATVCPVTRPSEWDEGLCTRKAIYRAFPQAVPITFAIEKADSAPCVITCPAGISVQGYVQLIKKGRYQEAVQLIMERLPLPGVLGRVCPHACEAQCRRLEIDEAVSIKNLKRFAADQTDLNALPLPDIEERPEKIAVVGSGPAGLTVAYYLRLKGYKVTIFEALPGLGGMLRVGIPDYRLPPEVLDREIDYILQSGIETRTGQRLGKDFTFRHLEEEGFQAVFLGIGAHRSIKANIPGEEEFEGVLDAVDFLRDTNLGERQTPGKSVVIIGGGNVAIDTARTVLRLGCEDVSVVYRRSREEMPAYQEEIEGALAEGVKIHYLASPVRILGREGKVTGFECIKNELGKPDASGRKRPVPIEGSEFVIECDAVIPAIGQRPDLNWVADDSEINVSRWSTCEVNNYTMQTGIPHVFAAGDAVTGPATVIEAVAAGHKAVEAIHRFINGEDLNLYAEEMKALEDPGRDWAEIPGDLEKERRVQPVFRDAGESVSSFDEVDLGFSEDEAQREASRCLNCGICSECHQCVEVCEPKAIDLSMEPEEREIKVGSIILATGYDLMDPTPMTQFGYGRYTNVITSLEFERLNNATGPTDGRIIMRDESGQFTGPPGSVAIIHCVGSRDVNYHEYCSRVCCMYALKYGHLIKDKVGHHAKIYDFYVDMRCFGKGYEEFYRRCQEEGIVFFRGKPAEVTDRAIVPEEEGKLIVISEDTLLLNKVYRIPVDMVILCSAIEARRDGVEVARIFGINQGSDGFFMERHPKMGPLNTATAGIFLAGACQGPKDIPDTVTQASGAAAQALKLAIRGKVEIPCTTAWIDPDVCEGCRTCIRVCEHSAIEFDEKREISVVNQALCKGCGNCTLTCQNNAAHIWQFGENQILTEFDGVVEGLRAVSV